MAWRVAVLHGNEVGKLDASSGGLVCIWKHCKMHCIAAPGCNAKCIVSPLPDALQNRPLDRRIPHPPPLPCSGKGFFPKDTPSVSPRGITNTGGASTHFALQNGCRDALQTRVRMHCIMGPGCIAKPGPDALQNRARMHCKLGTGFISKWGPDALQNRARMHCKLGPGCIAKWGPDALQNRARMRCKMGAGCISFYKRDQIQTSTGGA